MNSLTLSTPALSVPGTPLARLSRGVSTFQRGFYRRNKRHFVSLARHGQTPHTLFITCSDSRVDPGALTSTLPGELFMVRNIGNLVHPHSQDGGECRAVASAIEYATHALGITDIVVCGHSHCGACASLYSDGHVADLAHTQQWMREGLKVKEQLLARAPRDIVELKRSREATQQLLRATEKAMVVNSLNNLLTYPAVQAGLEEGRLALHGWHYMLETGEIEHYRPDTRAFAPLGAAS